MSDKQLAILLEAQAKQLDQIVADLHDKLKKTHGVTKDGLFGSKFTVTPVLYNLEVYIESLRSDAEALREDVQ